MSLVLIAISFVSPSQVKAIVDPLATQNNYFGIHIITEYDIADAATLVNGENGEGGYVTIVIRADQMDTNYWNKFFYELKENKLIPIVRIATTLENGYWAKPHEEDANTWAEFLNKLPWPTKNRYVILFNEPNHAKEWGQEIDPASYVQTARTYWQELKKQNDDFFVLPAALDVAASDTNKTMDAYTFWDRMAEYDPNVFTIFDGWNSHSYPNPGFSGDVADSGRMSIVSYNHEISYLEKYNLPANSPIFITETGWKNTLDADTLNEYYTKAFSEIWNKDNIVAVTPFILGYNSEPFEEFSWKNGDSGEFYDFYYTVANLPKTKGQPVLSDYKFTPLKIAYLKRPQIDWFVNMYDIWI